MASESGFDLNVAAPRPLGFDLWIDEQLRGLGMAGRRGVFQPLPAEASARRFFRVALAGDKDGPPRTVIAVHSPPRDEDNARFIRLARLFRAQGLRVPEVHAADVDRGFLLLEDLGSRDFKAAYAAGDADAALEAAIRVLPVLQRLPPRHLPLYTEARFADELGIFHEWLARRLLGVTPPRRIEAAGELLVAATQSVPQRPLHRDYHCRNLIWRRDGAVGIVDFQDALVGPVTYDIASLLGDCYHEFPAAAVAKWRHRYLRLSDFEVDAARFDRAFDFTRLQRQLKAVGIFARLWLRDGRRTHLANIGPVLRRAADVAQAYGELDGLAAWIRGRLLPRLT